PDVTPVAAAAGRVARRGRGRAGRGRVREDVGRAGRLVVDPHLVAGGPIDRVPGGGRAEGARGPGRPGQDRPADAGDGQFRPGIVVGDGDGPGGQDRPARRGGRRVGAVRQALGEG